MFAYMLNSMFYLGSIYTPIFVIQSKSEQELLWGQKKFFFQLFRGVCSSYTVFTSQMSGSSPGLGGGLYSRAWERRLPARHSLSSFFIKSHQCRCPEGSRERREDLGEAARGKGTFLDLEGKRNRHIPKNSHILKRGCQEMRSSEEENPDTWGSSCTKDSWALGVTQKQQSHKA